MENAVGGDAGTIVVCTIVTVAVAIAGYFTMSGTSGGSGGGNTTRGSATAAHSSKG